MRAGEHYWTHVADRTNRIPQRRPGTTIIDWFPSHLAWVAVPNGRVEKRVKSHTGQVFCSCGHGFMWWEGAELPCSECREMYRRKDIGRW